MSLQDILVYLDPSKHCGKRLNLAAFMARRLDCRLEGFYVMPDIDISPFTADQFPPESLMQIHAMAAQHRDRTRMLLEEVVGPADLRSEWVEARGDATELLTGRSRVNDLTVVGQVDPDEVELAASRSLPEEIALASGKPLLVVPYAGEFDAVGDRVLIAWNSSAQAARAVADAMPVLRHAKHVTVLSIGGSNEEWRYGNVPDGELLNYLNRHEVEAEIDRTIDADVDIGDVILSRTADDGADLLVMGIYGHSRLRELVLGGISRHVFQHMTVPVFMSH